MDYISMIADDMRLAHESRPHGIADSVDWSTGPRMGMGNEPDAFTAFIAWGQVYEAEEGNPAINTRAQIRNLRAYLLLNSDQQWHLVQDALAVEGAAYREDFADDMNKSADIRYEMDGSISITAGDGYNFHFWPSSGRVSIAPQDIDGVLVTVQARLILENPALADDREQARYVMSVGADYWESPTAQWDQWTTNGDVGIGRFRYITSDWQTFTMSSLDEAHLRLNPPPADDFRIMDGD